MDHLYRDLERRTLNGDTQATWEFINLLARAGKLFGYLEGVLRVINSSPEELDSFLVLIQKHFKQFGRPITHCEHQNIVTASCVVCSKSLCSHCIINPCACGSVSFCLTCYPMCRGLDSCWVCSRTFCGDCGEPCRDCVGYEPVEYGDWYD